MEYFVKIRSLKCLKLIYSILYVKACILVACLHLLRYTSTYTQLLDLAKLNLDSLRHIIDLRGIAQETLIYHSNNTDHLQNLVSNTGKKLLLEKNIFQIFFKSKNWKIISSI